MTKRYGIDLGTTYSTISWYDDSRQEVKPLPLESEDGETTSLRSVVYYAPEGTTVVGEVAWNTRKQDPGRVIVGIKRKMGEEYQTEPIDGRRRTPHEVSSDILRTLKDNAEIEMGEAVEDVVITVPAYFGERQCAATMEAARLAGLNVLNILSEPHAAAVAYSIEQNTSLTDKHVLVYDLGGGTFDVTLIKPVIPAAFAVNGGAVQNLTLNTLCKDGNRELGGLDWDEVLIDIVAEKCIEQFEVDPRLDARNAAVLHDNCEKAKRALSKKTTEMVVADLQGHMVEVTREEFEERSSGLLLQTQMRLEQVLADAEAKHGIGREQIDVLLCGGSTRMPMVKTMIQQAFHKTPLEYRNPQLLVANGAAYVAHAMDSAATIPLPGPAGSVSSGREVRITEDSITDITCHAVGIQVIRENADGERRPYNAVVLERGTTFGERRQFVTETLFDNQTEVCIRLFEGDDEDIEECTHLVDFRIEGLPPSRPRGRPIRTTLWFGPNGIIKGNAVDMETNTEIEIHYDRWGNTGQKRNRNQAPPQVEPKPIPMPGSQPVVQHPPQPAATKPHPTAPAAAQRPVAPASSTPRPVAGNPPVAGQPPVAPVKPVARPQAQPQQPALPRQPVGQTQPMPPARPVAPAAQRPAASPAAPPAAGARPRSQQPVAPVARQPVAPQGPFDPAQPFGQDGELPVQPVVPDDEAPQGSGPAPVEAQNPVRNRDNPPRETPRPLKLY